MNGPWSKPRGLDFSRHGSVPWGTTTLGLVFPSWATRRPDHRALGQKHFCLAKMIDDLLDRKTLPRHLLIPFLEGTRCQYL